MIICLMFFLRFHCLFLDLFFYFIYFLFVELIVKRYSSRDLFEYVYEFLNLFKLRSPLSLFPCFCRVPHDR